MEMLQFLLICVIFVFASAMLEAKERIDRRELSANSPGSLTENLTAVSFTGYFVEFTYTNISCASQLYRTVGTLTNVCYNVTMRSGDVNSTKVLLYTAEDGTYSLVGNRYNESYDCTGGYTEYSWSYGTPSACGDPDDSDVGILSTSLTPWQISEASVTDFYYPTVESCTSDSSYSVYQYYQYIANVCFEGTYNNCTVPGSYDTSTYYYENCTGSANKNSYTDNVCGAVSGYSNFGDSSRVTYAMTTKCVEAVTTAPTTVPTGSPTGAPTGAPTTAPGGGTNSDGGGNSMSAGATAGIVIGVLFGTALVGAAAFYFFNGPKKPLAHADSKKEVDLPTKNNV